MRFRWDSTKAAANDRKHGVSFREAATALRDSLSATYPDVDHSQAEPRYLTIGVSGQGKVLVVSHAEGEDDEEIRIISARLATRRERRFYEENR